MSGTKTYIPDGLVAITHFYGQPGRASNMVEFDSPYFRLGMKFHIRCNRAIRGELMRIMQEITVAEAKLHRPLVHNFAGCYNDRNKRGDSGEKSTHAWGIAIDINVGLTQPPELVAIFEKHGWQWGGRWKKPDSMHFQRCTGY
jgi:hypothetical protein